jgi:ABC-type lipoprotein release transport system permease subunit
MEGAGFVAPLGQVVAVLSVAAAVTISSVIPARSAGRIRPAVALRNAD